jgi:hypothetical protein
MNGVTAAARRLLARRTSRLAVAGHVLARASLEWIGRTAGHLTSAPWAAWTVPVRAKRGPASTGRISPVLYPMDR